MFKRPQHKCFPMNSAKFFRTAFFIEHLQRLLPELIVELYATSKCFIKYYLYDCRKLVYGVGAETVFFKINLEDDLIADGPERHRCSRSQMFFRISILKIFTIFTGNHMCWNLFLIKLQALTFLKRDSFSVFSCDYCEIFLKNTFFY